MNIVDKYLRELLSNESVGGFAIDSPQTKTKKKRLMYIATNNDDENDLEDLDGLDDLYLDSQED